MTAITQDHPTDSDEAWKEFFRYDCGCAEELQGAENDDGYNHRFVFCDEHDPIPLAKEVMRTAAPSYTHRELGNCGCIQERVLKNSAWGREVMTMKM